MDYAGKEELTNHITFRDLLVVLKAYVDYNSAFAAGAHLGLDQSVVYDRLARLEVLKGHVLMRDHNQHRIPVLNEHGESLLRGYAGLLLVGVK